MKIEKVTGDEEKIRQCCEIYFITVSSDRCHKCDVSEL